MAFLPDKELNSLIEKSSIPDVAIWPSNKFKNDLLNTQRIEEKQIVQTLTPQHIAGIAIPIFIKGEAIAALIVYLPERHLKPAHRQKNFENYAPHG